MPVAWVCRQGIQGLTDVVRNPMYATSVGTACIRQFGIHALAASSSENKKARESALATGKSRWFKAIFNRPACKRQGLAQASKRAGKTETKRNESVLKEIGPCLN